MTNKLRVWFWAIRPATISAAVVPVLVGSSLAFKNGSFNIIHFILILIACILVQMGTNLVDEYSDHNRAEDGNKLLAPYKVIALGLLTAKEVKIGSLVCFGTATVIGIYLVSISGWQILAICFVSALVAYFYAAGPKPLGNIGLGQPLVFVFMGPVMVLGTYFVQTHAFTLNTFLISLPVGCTVTAILAANDIRDLEEDQVTGKRTVVTAFGRRFAQWEYLFLLASAFLTVIGLVITNQLVPLSLLSLLAIPQAILALRFIWREKNRQLLVRGLQASSRLHWYFGALLAFGIALGYLL